MGRVDMKISARVICVDEGLIYVFSSCRSGYFEVWTKVRQFGTIHFQFGISAKSLSEACEIAYNDYLNDNLWFDLDDELLSD